MDFTPTREQDEVARLAADVLRTVLTQDRRQQLADTDTDFDSQLWRKFAEAGLLALPLPEEHGGAGLGLIEMCQVLIEIGRHVAPIPAAAHLPAAVALSRYGTHSQHHQWMSGVADGSILVTAALTEPPGVVPTQPATRAVATETGYRLDGCKTLVPVGTRAELFLVPASTDDGISVFPLTPDELVRVTGGSVASFVETRSAG